MAKTVTVKVVSYHAHPSIKRPGVHSKNKTSRNKGSKNYVKPYRGQGR